MGSRVRLLPPSAFQMGMSVTQKNELSPQSISSRGTTPVLPQTVTSAISLPVQFSPQTEMPLATPVGYTVHGIPQVERQAGTSSREAQLSAQVHVLEEQLQSRSNAYKAHIEKLEVEMRTILEQQQQNNMEHSKKARDYESQLNEKSTQIEQLKCYVTDNSAPSTLMSKKQLEQSQNKIQILEKEKRELESNIELLNIRLKSHDHIQNIQESEVSQAGDMAAEKKKQLLLKRWRVKVYELLVQLQSADIVQKKAQQIHNQRVSDLEKACENLKQQASLLQHALDDKQASLDLQIQNNKRLENELQSVENLALQLDAKNKGYQQTVNSLVQYTNSMYESFMEKEEKYTKMSQTLQQYNQRITFASGRVEMLQSQFARRDALLRMEMQKQGEQQRDKSETVQTDRALYEDLEHEVERVVRERDSLAKQSKQDMLTLEQKLTEARQQNECQIREIQEQNRELEDKLQLQAAELASALESVESSDREKSELHQTVEQLQGRLQQMIDNIQQEIANSYETEQQKHRQELAEVEKKLNDSSREHSKTVVSLRQLERQMGRERERMNEQMKSMEEYYKQHIAKLESNVKELEKERNLLMTTLRQEGLVGKHRAARLSPVGWQPDNDAGDVTTDHSYDVTAQEQRTDVTVEQSADAMLNSRQNETFDAEQLTLPGESEQHREPPGETKDTYFEETGDTQPQHEDEELADVIDEVKKLSEELMDDSSECSSRDSLNDVTQ